MVAYQGPIRCKGRIIRDGTIRCEGTIGHGGIRILGGLIEMKKWTFFDGQIFDAKKWPNCCEIREGFKKKKKSGIFLI